MLVAVDTGGTKTLVATFSRSGKILRDQRFPTPRDPQEYLELLGTTILELTEDKTIDAISVAIPGVTRGNVVVWCTNLSWFDFRVGTELKKRFKCPIFVENDANLAGLAETKALPKKFDNSLYITVSTGIGMGLIVDHKIHPALDIAEPEHMLLEYDGKLREWGSFASGRSIRKTYDSYARDIHDRHIWNQIADKISRGLLVLIPTINPDIIIIGGSIGTYFDRYEHALTKLLRERLYKHIVVPPIRQAVHPEEAVVYGCYYFAVDKLAELA
jgi:glucokinase